MDKSKDLKNFAEELELTVLKEEDAVLLDGMVGTSGSNWLLCGVDIACGLDILCLS